MKNLKNLDLKLIKKMRNFELDSNLITANDLASLTKITGSEIAPYRVLEKGGNLITRYNVGHKRSSGEYIGELLGGSLSGSVITNYPLHTHNFSIPKKYLEGFFSADKNKETIKSQFGLSREDLNLKKGEKGFIVFNDGNVLAHDRYGNCKVLENPKNIIFKVNKDYSIKAMRLK